MPTQTIDTPAARDSQMLEYDFVADRTGQVVATYLNLDTSNGSTGDLKFTLGVGERGIAALAGHAGAPEPRSTSLPQPWSPRRCACSGRRGASPTRRPARCRRTSRGISRGVVTQKALALAEAGLRVVARPARGGRRARSAVRFLRRGSGTTVDAGFDQLLRTTNAGTDLTRAIGNALKATAELAGGAAAYERNVSRVAASGPAFVAFAFGNAAGAPVTVTLTDGSGRESIAGTTSSTFVNGSVSAAVAVPFGTSADASRLVLLPTPSSGPYTLELTGTGSGTIDLSASVPYFGDVRRGTTQLSITQGARYRIVANDELEVDIDSNGDGFYDTQQPLTAETLRAEGPRLISANVLGPETLAGAAPFGFQTAILFDRIVDAATAANVTHYTIPNNRILSAKRQLSGRLVFASLEQPEGPYVPSQRRSVN